MPTIPVEALSFTFNDDWLVSKYDEWSFYLHRLKRIRANVLQKLKQLVKPIDAHPLVVETSRMASLAWTVTSRKLPATETSSDR